MNIELPESVEHTFSIYVTPDGSVYISDMYVDMTSEGWGLLGKHTVTIPVPQDVDPTGAMVASLEQQKRTELAESQKRLDALDEKIQQLKALEFQPA